MTFDNYLKNLINHTGPMSVADFMNEVLFNPKYGYYQTKLAIGKGGDFITAPEISQVFGEIIAAYLLNFFITRRSDVNNFRGGINLVEMGAGRGTLIKDILISLKKLADGGIDDAKYFLQFCSFNIIEISSRLKKIQQENLQEIASCLAVKINWYQDFKEFRVANNNQEIYFIANELFDCFAINQFVMNVDKSSGQQLWHEIKVALEILDLEILDRQENFKFFKDEFNPVTHESVKELVASEVIDDDIKFGQGAIFEHSFAAANFMQELASYIKSNSGLALIFDYGYIKNSLVNSLQAVKNHRKIEILEELGGCDITALVNFSMLERIAKNCGLNSSVITQREFLVSLGIEQRRQILLQNKNNAEKLEINSAINRLIDKNQMGELFKCMILWN
jgi:NADH dehydrogenase [ubiquinone] 1 alpha subcomplex assembly factor 7